MSDVSDQCTQMSGLARSMPIPTAWEKGPEGALIQDDTADQDQVAVVYDKGETPPEITITDLSNTVQAVNANGVAVAIIACSAGPRLTVDDVLLVERFVARAR